MSSYCPGCLVGSGSDKVDDAWKSFPGDSSCEGSVLVCCFELEAWWSSRDFPLRDVFGAPRIRTAGHSQLGEAGRGSL